MRKILYLAKKEVYLLKKSIILITVILAVFLASFMGIFSVRLNFIDGFLQTLDETNYTFYSVAYGANFQDVKKICGEKLYVCEIYGLTDSATMISSNGQVFNTYYRDSNGKSFMFNGALVSLNNITKSKFSTADGTLISGEWLEGDGEIVLEKYVAGMLEVGLGEIITIKDYDFTVKGIYDGDMVEPDYFFSYYFYISGETETQSSNVKIITSNATSAYSAYKKLAGKGYHTSACEMAYNYFSMISPVEITLNTVAAIILSVIVVIIYTLLMVFYRQRKQFICLLKILGADNFTSAGVYFVIIFGILLLSVSLGTALGLAFNAYFINLCTSIFELPFTLNFNFLVPVISLLISCLIAVAVCIVSAIKTKNATLANEIRCE